MVNDVPDRMLAQPVSGQNPRWSLQPFGRSLHRMCLDAQNAEQLRSAGADLVTQAARGRMCAIY
jgi:hypothetical protein